MNIVKQCDVFILKFSAFRQIKARRYSLKSDRFKLGSNFLRIYLVLLQQGCVIRQLDERCKRQIDWQVSPILRINVATVGQDDAFDGPLLTAFKIHNLKTKPSVALQNFVLISTDVIVEMIRKVSQRLNKRSLLVFSQVIRNLFLNRLYANSHR